MRSEHLGFDIDHITFTCSHFADLPQKGDARLDLYQKMVDRLNESPGILSAAITFYTPLGNRQRNSSFEALSEGPQSPRRTRKWPGMTWGRATFAPCGSRILAGREFEPRDRDRSRCILNHRRRITCSRTSRRSASTFVAPTSNCRPSVSPARSSALRKTPSTRMLRELPPRTIYFPVNKDSLRIGLMVFLMRSAHEAEAVAAYRKTLAEFAPTTPLTALCHPAATDGRHHWLATAGHLAEQLLCGAGVCF